MRDTGSWRQAAYNGGVEKVTAISIMSALAQPTRLEVFTMLAGAGPEGLTSGDLAHRTGAAANTMSAHLAILSRAGLVMTEKSGRCVIYRAVPETVRNLAAHLAALAN
jgi:ArsR family transcriptional regulator, arsenate/arsenite/antimonite-responsive transcriptional repressor